MGYGTTTLRFWACKRAVSRGVPLRAAVVSIVGVFGRVQRSGVREDYPNQSSKRYRSWLMLTSELPLPFSAGMMTKNLSDLSRSS